MTAPARQINRDLLTHDQRWRLDELTSQAQYGTPRGKRHAERQLAALTRHLLALQAPPMSATEAAAEIAAARTGVSIGQGSTPLPPLQGLTGEDYSGVERKVLLFDVQALKQDNTCEQVLEARGIQVRGRKCGCPVHGSRGTGVMAVYPDHVHCHSCGFHGDVIKLVAALEGLDHIADFKVVCEILGGQREASARVIAPTRRAASAAPTPRQRDLGPLADAAQKALRDGISADDPQCLRALEYLTTERGFSLEQIEAWGLGLITPSIPSALLPLVRDADRSDERWRGRITIPCRNADGSVYTVKARSVGNPPAGQDKYFNPSRTPVRPFLWGQLQPEADVLIVEGELDALSAMAAGIDDVIAVPGVGALSETHAAKLAQHGRPVYLLLDPDTLLERTLIANLKDVSDADLPTGPARAARNLARRLLAAGCDLRLVPALPGGTDLNGILAAQGPDALLEQLITGLENAVTLRPPPKRRRYIC